MTDEKTFCFQRVGGTSPPQKSQRAVHSNVPPFDFFERLAIACKECQRFWDIATSRSIPKAAANVNRFIQAHLVIS